MKIQNIVFIIFSLFLIVIFYKFQSNGQTLDSSVLRVGTSYDYKPYTFMDKDNKIVGFDIDLIERVAQKMGKSVKIVGMPFNSLIFQLLARNIDVMASAMSPTPQRKKFATFSNEYFSGDPLVIVSKKSNKVFDTLDSLKNKKTVVNTGFVADTYMSKQEGMNITRLSTPAQALMALQSGSVDAWVTAQSSANAFLQSLANPDQYHIALLADTGDDYAFVVHKHNEQLAEQINQALELLRAEGTLDLLKQKWKIS